MIKHVGIFLFMIWICASDGQMLSCDICQYNAFSRQFAFNDSLNASCADNPAFADSLKAAVNNSALFFVAHVQEAKNVAGVIETVTVVCDSQIRGPKVAKSFHVLNDFRRLWEKDCIISAQSIVNQAFLCILGTQSVPGELCSLGVWVGACGGIQGTFLTKSRIVSFKSQCSSYTRLCWDAPVFTSMNYIVGKTATITRKTAPPLFTSMKDISLVRVLDINGKIVSLNSRQALRLVIKDNKIRLQINR